MDDKILRNRIPDSELSNEFKRDGETLHGEDLNRIVTITKGGINYNAKLFESYLYGDGYRPFYHGNEVDWQTKDEYIEYGIVYWVRSILDVLTGLPYVYVTKMEYNGTSESWVEKEIIKFIDTEHLNDVLKDYLKKSGGDMNGNIDMGGYDITNVDTLKTFTLKANEIALLSSAGQETASIKLDENGNLDFNGKTVVNLELPEVDAKLSEKLDKVTTQSSRARAYVSLANGEQASLPISHYPDGGTLANRGIDGVLEVGNAVGTNDAVPLGQLNGKLETKVDKVKDKTTYTQAYTKTGMGYQNMLDVTTDAVEYTIAQRRYEGALKVGNPMVSDDAVNLKTMTEELDLKVDKVEGKQLSDENFTSAEKSKLAGLESSRFVGQFVSLQALNAAYPTAPIGSYAYVDVGSGKDTVKYVWDSSDEKWVSGTLSQADLTPARVKQLYEENDDTNAYTDDEKAKVDLIDNKLDKDTGMSLSTFLYGKMPDGSQAKFVLDRTGEDLTRSIPFRDAGGTFRVGNAIYGYHPVPLGQADERYVGLTGNQTGISGTKRFLDLQARNQLAFTDENGAQIGQFNFKDGKFNIENAAKNGEIAVMSDIDDIDLVVEQKTDKLESRQVGETTIQRNINGDVYQVVNEQVVEMIERNLAGRVTKVTEEYTLDGKIYETTFVRDNNGTVTSYKKVEVI